MNTTLDTKANWQEPIAGKLPIYHLAALAVVLIIASAVYFDTFRSMVLIWLSSDTFLHGFIILPLSVYLIWRKWPLLKSMSPKPFFLGVFLLLGISIGWFVADVLGLQVGKQLAATAILPATVITVMGVPFSRVIAFPLAYLFFAVPFGEFWVPELQDVTADLAVWLLRITGIPVLREGLFLTTPSGYFEVAEACSGIRYLLATLALGTLYAYLHYHRAYKRLIFIGFSFILPIVANGVRAYGIIAIAHYSDMKYAVGFDHLIYGWIFFGVVIVLMFMVGNRYRDDDRRVDQAVPDGSRFANQAERNGRSALIVLAAVAAMIVGPLAGHSFATSLSAEIKLSNGLPNAVAGWQGAILRNSDWSPSFGGASQETLASYTRSEVNVETAVIRYARRQQGMELANDRNSVFGIDGWKPRSTHVRLVTLDNGTTIELLESLASSEGVVRRFWYWYVVGDKPVVNVASIKLLEARSLLSGRPTISSVIIFSVIEYDGSEQALQSFVSDTYYSINKCLTEIAPQPNCDLGLSIEEKE